MTYQNILIIGAGKLGLPLAHQLHAQGHRITTLSKSDKVIAQGIRHITADIFELTPDSFTHEYFDWVYIILTPQERSLLGYQTAYVDSIRPIVRALHLDNPSNQPKRLIYISSTQVYGQNNGEIVNDNTLPYPSSDYGRILLSAELLWQAYLDDRLTIIRPSGIVSSDRQFLINTAKQLTHISEHHWLNLINRQDVITILASLPNYAYHLAQSNQHLKPNYILSHSPIIRHQLLNYIRQNHQLAPIGLAQDDLPITGKKLIATYLQDLLTQQQITLTNPYIFSTI